MTRALLTLAVLLSATAGVARADYIIIIANVGQSKDDDKPPAGGAAGAMGAAGFPQQAGALGAGGRPPMAGEMGAGGFPPAAGAQGAGGRPPMAGAMGAGGFPPAAGAMGAGGRPPMAGAMGAPGFPPAAGAMGMGGRPPAAGAMGGPPPNAGAFGAMGGPPPNAGAFGAGGIVPPMGAMGGEPQPGADFGVGGGVAGFFGAGGGSTEKAAPMRAMAVIEVHNRPRRYSPIGGKDITFVNHDWGASWLWGYDVEIVLIRGADRRVLGDVRSRFEEEKKKLLKGGAMPKAPDLKTLARWALEHGSLTDFKWAMNELVKIDKTLPEADAYLKVEAALKLKLNRNNDAQRWKAVFSNYDVATNEYYALLNRSRPDSVEVVSRLNRLKFNFEGFYYWHALQGKVLPMPQDKLVAVMVQPGEGGRDFLRQHSIFDSVAITADSFYSPRHNLIVFSGKRLDQPFEAVWKATSPYWKDFDRDRDIKPGAKMPRGKTVIDLYRAQTYALLIKALEEDGERASVSHSGTRQILVGAGLLPGTVSLPAWIESGVGSFMQTPYGSPWRSYGGPHWSHLLSFRELKEKKKLPSRSHDLLLKVIRNEFFTAADRKDPSEKARSTAWALTYYLAQKRLDNLHRYFKELSRLPRDIDVEGDALVACFARAFDCVDADKRLDEAKLGQLAEEWMAWIETDLSLDKEAEPILVAIHKLQNTLAQELKDNSSPKTQPVGPAR